MKNLSRDCLSSAAIELRRRRLDVTVDSNQSAPATVLALTILKANTLGLGGIVNGNSELLLAVRDPATNRSHPSVVSVPTQRIPPKLLYSLLNTAEKTETVDSSTQLLSAQACTNLRQSGHAELILLVNSLLALKLGVSEFLERKLIGYTAYIRALVTGTVVHPEYAEPTAMLNAVVLIESGADLFPTRTASYSHLMWRPVDVFIKTAREKNPLLLDVTLNPVQYCIHGMCIKSSFNVIATEIGCAPYPFDPYETANA
jgi:hypothetical protein